MAWFRKNDGSAEREELERLHRQQVAEGGEPVLEEAQNFLDKALESIWKSPAYSRRGRRSRRIDDYVSKHTIQTIREWFTVKDEDIDTSDLEVFTLLLDVSWGDQRGMQKVTNRLYQADVNLWVFRWWLEAPRSNKSRTPCGTVPSVTLPLPNGVAEHRQRLDRLRACKAEKQRRTAERKRIEQLEMIANRTPIDYESYGDGLAAVDEKSVYPAFAVQMRQDEFNESDVFDALQALSELVHQSRRFLPRLTAPVVQQFEARVLLSYCVRNRQARELAVATTQRDDAEEEYQKNIAKIYIQLLKFWIDPPRTSPSSGVYWADAIGSALQELARVMLVH